MYCVMKDMVAFVLNRLEPKSYEKTKTCFVQSPQNESASLSQHQAEREKGDKYLVIWESRSQEAELECVSH